MKFLTDEQLAELLPAETSSFASPVPTQIVSSDEYMPVPQTEKQRAVEARLKELSDWVGSYREFWKESFERLDQLLEELQTPAHPDTKSEQSAQRAKGEAQ